MNYYGTRRPAPKSSKLKLIATIGGALSLTLALSSCTTSNSAGPSDGQMSTDTIRTTIVSDPNSFDPLAASGVSAYIADALLYGTLLNQDDDNQVAGGLASDWDINPNGGTFTIEADATCADGTPITPSVVKDSLQAFIDESRNKEVVFGPSTPTLTADDATNTLTIDLATPWTDLARGLTLPESGIICPAGLEDREGLAMGNVEAAFSGPYILSDYDAGAALKFTLREDYIWPEYAEPLEGVPANTIEYTINADSNSVANGLLTGTIDIANVTGEPMERFVDNDEFYTERFTVAAGFIMFNEREGMPFAKEENRRAVAQILNQDAYNEAANGGTGTTMESFVPAEVQCALTTDDELIKEDPTAAESVLQGQSLNLLGTQTLGPNGAGNSYVAQVIDGVGAEVSLRNVDPSTWSTELDSKPQSWDFTVMPLLNSPRTMYGGLSPFVGTLREEGGRNSTGTEKQEIMDLMNGAVAEPDEELRCEQYREVQTRLIEGAHIIPLATVPSQVTAAEGFSTRVVNGSVQYQSMRITK